MSKFYGQEIAGWLRYPAISPDGTEIAFTYKGDLYKVNASGGVALQLTFHEAHDFMPVWSNDGNHIAFASDRYGNFDIYSMESIGGPAKRLTFHSNDELPYSFSQDDASVIFGAQRQDKVDNRQYPISSQAELYQVPVAGGRIGQIFTIPAELVQVSRDGSKMIYQDNKGRENEWRKHHKSSITRDIWLYDKTTDQHKMISTFEGEDRQPVFGPDESSVYYLSEESGSFNVHKMSTDGSAKSQLTDFKSFPVRFLSITDEGLMCFSYDGQLYTYRDGDTPQKLDVIIRTQDKSNADKYLSVNGDVNEMTISPDGKEIAFIANGEVFATTVDGSMTKRVTNTPAQERFISYSPDGKSIMYAREANGKWAVYKTTKIREQEKFFFASTLLKEEAVIENDHDNYQPQYSPDGKSIAFIEDRRILKVLQVDSMKTTVLMNKQELIHMSDGDQYFTWSPDSKWLLVDWNKTLSNSDVLLLSSDGEKRINLTESGYSDNRPKWVNDGKQMIWMSNRNGLKSYATSGSTEYDVYSMFFNKEAWDKFNLSEEDYKLMKELEKKEDDDKDDKKEDKDKKEADKKVADVIFDWDGMTDRKTRLTIHSSSLGDAILSKDGETLYYLARFEKGMNLWSTNLRTKETKMAIKLDAQRANLSWDKDMKNLYLLSNGSISKIDPESGKKEAVNIKSEMNYDYKDAVQSMYDHVNIRTKAIFYHSDFHGQDWELLTKEYQKYLPHIGNSYEFAEMLSELLGELNVSHAGARYSNSIDNADATASLGIFMDYQHSTDGILISEIIKGGPLDKANVPIKAGMIIEKIDGITISSDRDVASFLNRKSDQLVLLEYFDPSTKKRDQCTVKPTSLNEERQLLYDRWVERNEKEVIEKSNGQLGYVHIPGMSDEPYRNIYEEMLGKFADSKGAIIDTRFNGGGDLVADLAMFFTGQPFITYATETKVVGGEPTSRWTKPTLAIFNESMYSDGHCFASGYTDLKIGKTVGMPVPGTCSFAGWERLPDGTRWGVVPVSAKNMAGEWMENNQTEPMYKVQNMPGYVDKGIDQQLEKSIEELLKDVK